MPHELLGRMKICEDDGDCQAIRDELYTILTKTGSQNGWVSVCKSAVESNSEDWLSKYANAEGDHLPWFLERLHKRELNPRESKRNTESEPLFARVGIAQSISSAALSALLLRRLSEEAEDHRVQAVLESIYRAVVKWQSNSNAKSSLNADIRTLTEVRSCLRDNSANGYRTILTTLQVRHPEWEVAPIAALISYFLDDQKDEWERMVSVNVPLVRWDKTGFIARIDLEKRRSGVSAFYRDPFTVGFLQYDASFKEALDSAWSYIKTEFDVDGYEVKWRLATSGQDIPNPVTGSSAGAGVAVALSSLFTDDRKFAYGSKWAITGTVQDDGSIGTVNGNGSALHDNYREKLEAVAGRHLKLIVPGEDWQRVREDLSSGPINVLRGASTVKEASYIIINEERGDKWRRFFKRAFIASAAATFLLFIFASAAAAYAWKQRNQAETARFESEKQRDLAQKNEAKAKESELLADQNARLAKANELLAKENERLARNNEQAALSQKRIAEKERHIAEIARNEAQEQRQIAEGQKQEAARQSVIASAQRQLALAREAELQGQTALAEGDGSAAQVFFAKALTLDYRLETAARLLEAKGKTRTKLLWSSSDDTFGREIDFSLDGKYVASGGKNNTVLLIDASTGKTLRKLEGHKEPVTTVKFDPNGRFLASGGTDGFVRVWDLTSGNQVHQLKLELKSAKVSLADGVPSMAFSPDGHLLVIGAKSHESGDTVWIWNLADQGRTATLKVGVGDIINVAVSRRGYLAVSGSDRKVRLWKVNEWNGDSQVLEYQESVESLAFGSDGILAVGTSSRIQIWDVDSSQEVHSLSDARGTSLSLAFTFDGQYLASANEDKTIQLWDVDAAKQIATITGLDSLPIGLTFTKAGRLIAGSLNGPLKCWSVLPMMDFRVLSAQSAMIHRLTFSNDGKSLASSSADGTVIIWDTTTGIARRSFRFVAFSATAYSPSGRFLAVSKGDNSILIVDANDGRKISILRGHEGEVTSLAFSIDDKYLASGSDDKSVRIWSLDTATELSVLRGNNDAPSVVTFSSNGLQVATGGLDNTIRVWDLKSGKMTNTLSHPGQLWAVAFSPDGKTIASSCSGDSVLRLWNLNTGTETMELRHPSVIGRPAGIAFSSDGRRLIWASGAEKKVRMWDLDTGWELTPLIGPEGALTSVAITSDGKWIASAGIDSNIYVWNMQNLESAYSSSSEQLFEEAKRGTGLDLIGPSIHLFSSEELDQILGIQRSLAFTLMDEKEASNLSFWRTLHISNRTQFDDMEVVCPNAPSVPTLNPFPINYGGWKPCADAPAIDVSVAGDSFSASEDDWKKERKAKTGDQIDVRLYINNGASFDEDKPSESTAKNIMISTDLDSSTGTEHWISVSFKGLNTNTISTKVLVRTGPRDHLEVVPGSGLLYDSQGNLLRSGFDIADGKLILPELQSGSSNSLWILYRLRVTGGNRISRVKTSEVIDLSNTSTPAECPNAPRFATLNPYPLNFAEPALIPSCMNAPPLALRVVGRTNKIMDVSDWNKGIDAKAGDEIFVRIFVSNGASASYPIEQTLARNVKVQTVVDTPIGSDHLISVFIGGDNTNRIIKTLHVRTGPSDALEVEPNSGEAGDGNQALARNFQLGNNIFRIGDIAPGNGSSIFLVFKVRVVTRPK